MATAISLRQRSGDGLGIVWNVSVKDLGQHCSDERPKSQEKISKGVLYDVAPDQRIEGWERLSAAAPKVDR